jgi:hypothetical protein
VITEANSGASFSAVIGATNYSLPLDDGGLYQMEVTAQPDSPSQHCSLNNATGSIAGADVLDVDLTCEHAYSVGGTVSGLQANDLVLQNNGADDLVINSNSSGTFNFNTRLPQGQDYRVSIHAYPNNPTRHACSVANAEGSIATAPVSDIHVTCENLAGSFSNGLDAATLAVALGNVDDDGDLDLVTGNYNEANRIWFNDGNGNFSDSGQELGSRGARSLALGDVDGDGDLDLAAGNYNQANRIYLNQTH